MESVDPSTAEPELDLLLQWGEAGRGARTGRAAVLSVAIHVAVISAILLAPAEFFAPNPPRHAVEIQRVTPLVDPITEFTQKRKNQGKLSKEIDMASLQPRERIQTPKGLASTTRPRAPRPAEIPAPPEPKPPAPVALPEPPKIEAASRPAPKIDLPPAAQAPQIQPVEKPKLALENVGAPPPPVPPNQRQIAIPDASVANAIRQNAHQLSPSGGLVVGDPGAGPGGIGEGINLPPSPGVQGSALELKSDPMGVDFRPYLTQILATIKRNWFAVMPESVKLGRRGKVGLLFSIARSGTVAKVTWAFQSGSDPLDRAAVAAISASNPFPPLPPEYKGDRIVLQLNFAYNLPK
ncbi:MAG: TonB C-terminal domain-containing protein [Acidobacteria bacterium]|nr:TonB C-terminal domain-containing protein [Acidobacteriota bacterium]